MIFKAILFDLDGTLLPMDQDIFVHSYLKGLAIKLAPNGFEPRQLVKSIWDGTAAMVKNDGSRTNEETFWASFSSVYGADARKHEGIFQSFYDNEFQDVRHVCGYDPDAASTIAKLKKMGVRVILATNPLFPAIATHSRIRWAGMEPDDFELITTYENSSFCKPNPKYYLEILDKIGCRPQECLMVGNDVDEDMIARELGMEVFLLTECLINKSGKDISRYSQGTLADLLSYVYSLEDVLTPPSYF